MRRGVATVTRAATRSASKRQELEREVNVFQTNEQNVTRTAKSGGQDHGLRDRKFFPADEVAQAKSAAVSKTFNETAIGGSGGNATAKLAQPR